LGLIISENHVEMDPVKVAGVADWPEPSNKREVQLFLGFANFYQRFIKDFSHHARPPFNLTRNDQKWQWEASEASAFRKIKESAYFSKSLSETERNYEIHDKEMLAIIRALEEWRHFLQGALHKFEIWTDHKNLEYFMSQRN